MNISKDNLDCIKNLPGVNVTSCIVPCTEKDKYATHDSFYGKGGWREVDTIIERDAIPVERRKVGMAVYVAEKDTIYVLRGAVNNYCWRPWNALDDIVNNAIADGTLQISVANCVTQRQLEQTLFPYIKETEVDSKFEDYDEEIKKWVEDKNYLTEHQSLDAYATMEWVEEQGYLTEHQALDEYVKIEVLDEVVDNITEAIQNVQAQIDTNVDEIKAIKEDLEAKDVKLGELKDNITEIQEALGGGEDKSFATTEELQDLSTKVFDAIEATNTFVVEATNPLITKTEVETTYAKQSALKTAVDALKLSQQNYLKADDLNGLLEGKGYLTKSYLRGYATEFYVQDYVAQVMKGNIKPGEPTGGMTSPAEVYEAEIAELKEQIATLKALVDKHLKEESTTDLTVEDDNNGNVTIG